MQYQNLEVPISREGLTRIIGSGGYIGSGPPERLMPGADGRIRLPSVPIREVPIGGSEPAPKWMPPADQDFA